jgi:hypothetical protein
MEFFNKRMALEVLEDSLTDLDRPYGRGMTMGLCSAFYMCGMLSDEEWVEHIKLIPAETVGHDAVETHQRIRLH